MTQFLPTFDTASAHNRRMTTGQGGEAGGIEFVGDWPREGDRFSARAGLASKQIFARYLGGVSCETSGEALKTSDWDNLTEQTYEWVRGHIAAHPFMEYEALGLRSEPEAKRHILRAAHTGIATVSAFLEVIPRVLAAVELEKPGPDVADYGRRSKGFIMEWMGLHDEVDYQLAYALALKKPLLHTERVFEGLRFNPKWFCVDAGRVKLNPQRAINLRDMTHGQHPSVYQPRVAALLGCPARKMIPRLYDTMLNQAESQGLSETTYWKERSDLGL